MSIGHTGFSLFFFYSFLSTREYLQKRFYLNIERTVFLPRFACCIRTAQTSRDVYSRCAVCLYTRVNGSAARCSDVYLLIPLRIRTSVGIEIVFGRRHADEIYGATSIRAQSSLCYDVGRSSCDYYWPVCLLGHELEIAENNHSCFFRRETSLASICYTAPTIH